MGSLLVVVGGRRSLGLHESVVGHWVAVEGMDLCWQMGWGPAAVEGDTVGSMRVTCLEPETSPVCNQPGESSEVLVKRDTGAEASSQTAVEP